MYDSKENMLLASYNPTGVEFRDGNCAYKFERPQVFVSDTPRQFQIHQTDVKGSASCTSACAKGLWVITSANGFIAFMERGAANAAITCYSSIGLLNSGADAITGAFTIYKVAALKKVSDAPSGTVGTYNMATATIAINVGGCAYTFQLNSGQKITVTSPGTTPVVSSGKTSAAPYSPGTLLLAALAALLLSGLERS